MAHKLVIIVSAAVALSGCVAAQTGENTIEMTDGISHIREDQVLRNISAAITDHDAVPSQILLTTGQATVAVAATPTLKIPNLDISTKTREFDLSGSDTWTAQWQFTSVTNADDLRRLRNLYALVASTDDEYKALTEYFVRHSDLKTNDASADNEHVDSLAATRQFLASSPFNLEAAAPKASLPNPSGKAGDTPPAIGNGPGSVPLWKQAVRVLHNGDSIGCKLYQEDQKEQVPNGIPFRRWLYWRKSGNSGWLPNAPASSVTSLGRYNDWELGVTSRACLDDFVILVQGQAPAAEKQADGGAKVMLNPNP